MQRTPIRRWLPAAATALSLAVVAPTQQFTNGSFESWGNSNCDINSAPDGWQKFLGPGLNPGLGVDEGKPTACPHTIPGSVFDGLGYARAYSLPNGGEGISQVVAGFVPGRSYRVRYHYAGSNVYGGTADGYWRSYVDGAPVDTGPTISSQTATWAERTFTFVATAASHTIGFLGFQASPTSSASLAIDAVEISDAAVWAYGAGCSVGSPLTLTANVPLLGASWTLQAGGIEPVGNLAVFWYGDTQLTPPVDLAVIGANGCFGHHNANLGAFVQPVSASTASHAVSVPQAAALQGVALFVQVSAASAATPVGFTTSNGLAGVIGF